MAKALKFKCPECGGNCLKSVEKSVEEYSIINITDDKDNPIEYSDKSELIDHYKDRFICGDCGREIRVNINKKIQKDIEQDLVEWIKKHCSQD